MPINKHRIKAVIGEKRANLKMDWIERKWVVISIGLLLLTFGLKIWKWRIQDRIKEEKEWIPKVISDAELSEVSPTCFITEEKVCNCIDAPITETDFYQGVKKTISKVEKYQKQKFQAFVIHFKEDGQRREFFFTNSRETCVFLKEKFAG